MKAFEIVHVSMPECVSICAATTAGKAKYQVALTLNELGYSKSVGEAFKGIRCKRRKDLDLWAATYSPNLPYGIARSPEYVTIELKRTAAEQCAQPAQPAPSPAV